MADFYDGPRIHVSVEHKVNLGNYESASVSMGIAQLPFDADEETIRQAMKTQSLAYKILSEEIRTKIAKIRREPAKNA